MAEMKILDLNELGRAVDVPSREFTPPIPGAKPMLEQVWDGDYVQKAVDYLQKNYKSKGGQYSILGHVPSWVCIAFADALMPECECFFATPNHDENNTFTHLPIYDLKTGALDPSIPYQQTVREEGDFIYVDFGLTEDVSWEDLINKVSPNLTLPELPALLAGAANESDDGRKERMPVFQRPLPAAMGCHKPLRQKCKGRFLR